MIFNLRNEEPLNNKPVIDVKRMGLVKHDRSRGNAEIQDD